MSFNAQSRRVIIDVQGAIGSFEPQASDLQAMDGLVTASDLGAIEYVYVSSNDLFSQSVNFLAIPSITYSLMGYLMMRSWGKLLFILIRFIKIYFFIATKIRKIKTWWTRWEWTTSGGMSLFHPAIWFLNTIFTRELDAQREIHQEYHPNIEGPNP